MSASHNPQGVEPIGETQRTAPPRPPASPHPGITLSVRGRTIRLRALRQPPRGVFRWLAILGPGLVSGAVSNDPGSIATYSQAGAQFGYDLLWVLVVITLSLAVVQEMSARLGAATGRGLLGLIRTHFGIGWALLATGVILVANFGLTLGEFVGISSAMAIFGVNKLITVAVTVVLIAYLVTAGSYNRVEKVFMVMAAVFLAYPVAAILAHPSLGAILRGTFVPTVHLDPAFVSMFVALIGTTISPYQQVFQQSAVVEKGIPRRHYGPERWDTYVGAILSNLVSLFIVIATAATLHQAGKTQLNTAAEAAKALQPVAGSGAEVLFALGIVGAALMAIPVITMATSFAYTDAFGLQEGLGVSLRRAPVFYGLFFLQLLLAAGASLLASGPAFQLLVDVQILNGMLFPVILLLMLLLANNPAVMDHLKNGRLTNLIGWGTLGVSSLAVLFGLSQRILPLLGIHIFGG